MRSVRAGLAACLTRERRSRCTSGKCQGGMTRRIREGKRHLSGPGQRGGSTREHRKKLYIRLYMRGNLIIITSEHAGTTETSARRHTALTSTGEAERPRPPLKTLHWPVLAVEYTSTFGCPTRPALARGVRLRRRRWCRQRMTAQSSCAPSTDSNRVIDHHTRTNEGSGRRRAWNERVDILRWGGRLGCRTTGAWLLNDRPCFHPAVHGRPLHFLHGRSRIGVPLRAPLVHSVSLRPCEP